MEQKYAHHVIKNDILEVTPIDIFLAKSKPADKNIVAGCKAFYDFNINLLTDMLENPEQYLIYPGEYEALMEGQPEFAGARWQAAAGEATAQKLGNIENYTREEREKFHEYEVDARNKTNYAILFYRKYLFLASQRGEIQNGRLVIPKNAYEEMMKSFGGGKYLKKKDMPTRLQAFSRVGLNVFEEADTVVFEYPKENDMLPVMMELAKQAGKNKDYGYFNFIWCNFGQLSGKYKPDFEDAARILRPENRKTAEELHGYAKSLKISPNPYLPWRLMYNYKGQVVFRFSTNNGDLSVTAMHCVDCKDIEIFDRMLENENEKL